MNVQTSSVMAPPAPRSLEGMLLPMAMMRDILIKTMFRRNLTSRLDVADALCITPPIAQELIDMARETNLIDMAWHDREFDARRAFSWIIRDAEGTYLGCFYLFPELGTRGRAKATFWLCDLPDRVGFAATLKQDLSSWLADKISPAIILTWVTRPTL